MTNGRTKVKTRSSNHPGVHTLCAVNDVFRKYVVRWPGSWKRRSGCEWCPAGGARTTASRSRARGDRPRTVAAAVRTRTTRYRCGTRWPWGRRGRNCVRSGTDWRWSPTGWERRTKRSVICWTRCTEADWTRRRPSRCSRPRWTGRRRRTLGSSRSSTRCSTRRCAQPAGSGSSGPRTPSISRQTIWFDDVMKILDRYAVINCHLDHDRNERDHDPCHYGISRTVAL